ncbi:hypothetical protein LA664_02110 [Lactobacillus amylolyticus]|nr:hypothetical protein [Lactobacillus amylolyticus]QFY04160.1 hypothetical protein LA664_02110 [Lactobacillus amylolyticus]TDG61957.1 hypothetical protein C5L18_001285 [Lactobacillus amylolyticus]
MNNTQIYLNQLKEWKNLRQIQQEMDLPFCNNEKLTDNLISNEQKIYKLNKVIRQDWRRKIGDLTSSIYKSTLWQTNISDAQGAEYHYSYETLLNDENAFSDLLGYSIQGMHNKTFLFSSGMNAISNILYCFSSFIRENLNIQASVGYFETKYFFKILSSMGNRINLDIKCDIDANVFYFEPIKYDATLSVTNIDDLIDRINNSKAKIKFVIMDSTMHNRTNIFQNIIKKISNIRNIVFCDIRSGLKLDQEGLELTNLGICTVFISKQSNNFFEAVKRYIEQYKGLTGTNISFHALALSHYFKFNSNSIEYTSKVRKQLIWAQKFLTQKDLSNVKRIVWRKVKLETDTLVVPFIFIELNENNEEVYLSTIQRLQNEMNKLKTPIDYRNSWGFRMPSVEYFNDIFSKKRYIKFYPGMFKGLTAVNALNVLGNL